MLQFYAAHSAAESDILMNTATLQQQEQQRATWLQFQRSRSYDTHSSTS